MEVEVLCVEPKSKLMVFSYFIKFFQKTKYSHMAIVFEGQIIDSTIHGTEYNIVEDFYKTYRVIKKYKKTLDCTPSNFALWFENYRGHQYSVFQSIAVHFKNIGWFKKNPFGQGGTMLNCCELVVLMLAEFSTANISLSDDSDLNITEKYLIEDGWKC